MQITATNTYGIMAHQGTPSAYCKTRMGSHPEEESDPAGDPPAPNGSLELCQECVGKTSTQPCTQASWPMQ